MIVKLEKPSFLAALPKAIGKSAGERHWRSVIPVWLTICFAIGAGLAYALPEEFWSANRLGTAVLIYVGVFIVDGFLLAVCWSTFTRLYEAMSAPGFFSYLVSEELMPGYIVYIQLVHAVHLFAIFASAIGIVVLLMNPSHLIYDQIAFAVMVSASAYAVRSFSHLTHVVQDVLWQKAIVDEYPRHGGAQILALKRPSEKAGN